MSDSTMPRGAERFVFIHSKPFWYEWMRPQKAIADRGGLYRLRDNPTTVIIVNDHMDPDANELSPRPNSKTVEQEKLLSGRSGERSLWLEWWYQQEAVSAP